MTKTIASLPAHPYNDRQESGILLKDGQATIFNQGEEVLTAPIPATINTPWEFWYNLVFAKIFPEVEHFWFISGWTQQVRLHVLNRETKNVRGLMQFTSDENAGQLWFFDHGEVSHPYPTAENFAGNVPLRLILSRMIYQAAVKNMVVQDQWYVVTSLVKRSELAQTFPILWTAPWWYTGMYDKNDARASLCASLGIAPPLTIKSDGGKPV